MESVNLNIPLDTILETFLDNRNMKFARRLLYGQENTNELLMPPAAEEFAKLHNITLQGYSSSSSKSGQSGEEIKPSKNISRIGIFQNSIPIGTDRPIQEQKDKLHELAKTAIELAAMCGVRIFCLQELWNMPMGFCTQKKLPWVEFAEDAESGCTTSMLKVLAKRFEMVIISPILERDESDFLWNTAVVIDSDGEVLGKARKTHIPLSGKFSECSYYNGSDSGIPVFHTQFGRIGLNICYDRHHPQNWYVHALNRAQIVFNPCATVQSFSEHLWPIEARSAAIANGYFVAAINRVGSETFNFDGKSEIGGPFFGSSYVAFPDGRRTPGLPINKNGILAVDVDFDLCIEVDERAKS